MQYLQIVICQIFQYIVYYAYLLHFIRADHLFFFFNCILNMTYDYFPLSLKSFFFRS
jgi:hypothetical protein